MFVCKYCTNTYKVYEYTRVYMLCTYMNIVVDTYNVYIYIYAYHIK